ncbi:hypothetical protein GQ55_6G061600 [Panicum hallii var. hallii]|uniref:Myb/SANT-like domain-containing protein n=1 Tax=Panicum hallii var. hallii TaxID=1504633 RepID=A0A2T7D4L3_9POAL|nr:hypothetical protein GQ55_6G061600 [Panicum hallii var. hallii]
MEKLNYNKKGLTKIGWSNLYRNFRQQTGRTYDSKQLQNKFNSLKRQYKYWRQLKDKSGGGWNNNTGTIGSNEECREDGTMLCVGGIGDKTPSRGKDNVGRSCVDRVAQRSGKEHIVDSPPPKKTKSMEYYVECTYERMIQRNRYERSATSREQEMTELLQLAEEDGVSNGSELYFIATELFRSPGRRAAHRSIKAAKSRIAWLRWTWDNVKKK